jgi:hypothetical protein
LSGLGLVAFPIFPPIHGLASAISGAAISGVQPGPNRTAIRSDLPGQSCAGAGESAPRSAAIIRLASFYVLFPALVVFGALWSGKA